MNELIIYDGEEDVWFEGEEAFKRVYFSESSGKLETYYTYQNIFWGIGKTDDTPEQNKIYADSSIVELVDFVNNRFIGYFVYDNKSLGYKLKITSDSLYEFYTEMEYISNLKVIGTLQEDKYLLGDNNG